MSVRAQIAGRSVTLGNSNSGRARLQSCRNRHSQVTIPNGARNEKTERKSTIHGTSKLVPFPPILTVGEGGTLSHCRSVFLDTRRHFFEHMPMKLQRLPKMRQEVFRRMAAGIKMKLVRNFLCD